MKAAIIFGVVLLVAAAIIGIPAGVAGVACGIGGIALAEMVDRLVGVLAN